MFEPPSWQLTYSGHIQHELVVSCPSGLLLRSRKMTATSPPCILVSRVSGAWAALAYPKGAPLCEWPSEYDGVAAMLWSRNGNAFLTLTLGQGTLTRKLPGECDPTEDCVQWLPGGVGVCFSGSHCYSATRIEF